MQTASARVKNAVFNVFILVFAVTLGTGFAEIFLRLKNADQKNYNVEMWRYAKLLKVRSADENLGHEHRPNSSARLEGVDIRINSLGMRGPEPDLTRPAKRILILGSSNTLGWGVKEEDTMAAQLQKTLGDGALVLNAGIGNYNAHRYVSLYEKRLRALKPDVVVVHYFIRDAEVLSDPKGNWFLRHSQLAVTLFHLMGDLSYKRGSSTLTDYYRKIYSPGNPGLEGMETALDRLDALSKEDGFKIVFTIVPDVHAVSPYPFGFVHDHMKAFAQAHGWTYVDFSESLFRVPAKDLSVMPSDPHVNGKGHKIMAETLAPYLA